MDPRLDACQNYLLSIEFKAKHFMSKDSVQFVRFYTKVIMRYKQDIILNILTCVKHMNNQKCVIK